MSEAATGELNPGESPAGVVSGNKQSDWVEILAAVLLAIAVVASAWSAYQSARWSGVMTIEFSRANATRTAASTQANIGAQKLVYDASATIDYVIAYVKGDTTTTQLYERRLFSPELNVAIEAWKLTDPVNNPNAPRIPLEMPEYVNPYLEESARLQEEADIATQDAKDANQRSDNYVLLTVLFASVLFFAGIGTKFSSKWLRLCLVIMGFCIFTGTAIAEALQKIH